MRSVVGRGVVPHQTELLQTMPPSDPARAAIGCR